jgi:hypothetical protein
MIVHEADPAEQKAEKESTGERQIITDWDGC